MLQNLISAGIVGLILGFDWVPTPRAFRELSVLIKLPVTSIAALIAGLLSGLLGVNNTAGIDWTELIIDLAVGFLVASIVVWSIARVRAHQHET